MQCRNTKTYNNTTENTHLQSWYSKCGCCRVGGHCLHTATCGNKGADGSIHNKVGDSTRKCSYLFFSFCHTYGNTHCEKKCKVVKNHATRFTHNVKNCVEKSTFSDDVCQAVRFKRSGVSERTAYAEKKSGNRQ